MIEIINAKVIFKALTKFFSKKTIIKPNIPINGKLYIDIDEYVVVNFVKTEIDKIINNNINFLFFVNIFTKLKKKISIIDIRKVYTTNSRIGSLKNIFNESIWCLVIISPSLSQNNSFLVAFAEKEDFKPENGGVNKFIGETSPTLKSVSLYIILSEILIKEIIIPKRIDMIILNLISFFCLYSKIKGPKIPNYFKIIIANCQYIKKYINFYVF